VAIGALVTLMGVWFAAMASPGPDVVQIIRLGARSTRAAVWVAIGSTTGLALWTIASLAGLSALISTHEGILVLLQVLGGSYLLWMAYSAISSGLRERRAPPPAASSSPPRMPPISAIYSLPAPPSNPPRRAGARLPMPPHLSPSLPPPSSVQGAISTRRSHPLISASTKHW